MMPGAAYIISWNVWQMDGLSYGLPGYEPYIEEKKQGQDSGPSLLMEWMAGTNRPRLMNQNHKSGSVLSKTSSKASTFRSQR